MATVTVHFTDELSPTFSFSALTRAYNLDFCYWKSTQRLTSVAYDRRGFGIGVKLKATTNLYSYTEVARPEERKSLNDFLVEAGDFVRSDGGDGGPPRWFSPLECGARDPESPLLLYLPGIDGTGLGLIRQHKRLGEIFDIWCLHFPVTDRTPARELVKLIERTVRSEHDRFPNRPIYIVGESIGASLALDVAASNPDIDLVLILANPVTHFNNFMLQPLLGLLESLPDGVPSLIAENFGFNQGSPLTEMFETMLKEADAAQMGNFFATSSNLPTLIRIFPKDTLLWKLQLLKSASAYANFQMDIVNAQTLILLSGRDQWLMNKEDIERLRGALPRCEVRELENNGQFLFLEDGVDLVSIIKRAYYYRRGKSLDYISDYIPPTPFEFKEYEESQRLLTAVTSPVFLSTLNNGAVVRSLVGIPSEGPALYVGNHMLLGMESHAIALNFLKERNILLRGLAHPLMFTKKRGSKLPDMQMYDLFRIIGAVPVSGMNFYKLLRSKAHVALYPGGVREALHRKGEEYKLFWPEHSEFIRVASKFGAQIIPFGVVGEDDLCEIVLDYNDQMKIPFLKNLIEEITQDSVNLRNDEEGELGKQYLHVPGVIPKIPGRIYIYFGKPIETRGREKELNDKERAHEVYLQVKSEVERCMTYLKTKRETDPYRNILPRDARTQARIAFYSVTMSLNPVRKRCSEQESNRRRHCWYPLLRPRVYWTKTEELLILKGIVDYQNETKLSYASDWNAFYDRIRGSMKLGFSKVQLQDKVHKLKNVRFKANQARSIAGKRLSFTDPHDKQVFDLSNIIWGENETDFAYEETMNQIKEEDLPCEEQESLKLDDSEKDKGEEAGVDDLCVLQEALVLASSFQSLGNNQRRSLLRNLRKVGATQRKELKDEWKALLVEEMQLDIKKQSFYAKLVNAGFSA